MFREISLEEMEYVSGGYDNEDQLNPDTGGGGGVSLPTPVDITLGNNTLTVGTLDGVLNITFDLDSVNNDFSLDSVDIQIGDFGFSHNFDNNSSSATYSYDFGDFDMSITFTIDADSKKLIASLSAIF